MAALLLRLKGVTASWISVLQLFPLPDDPQSLHLKLQLNNSELTFSCRHSNTEKKMNMSAMSNTVFSTGSFTTSNSTSNGSSSCDPLGSTYNAALIAIYTLVLVGGSTGAIIMTWKIKTDSKSVTSTAMVNLILMHTFFLLTVPFRISYYVLAEWKFGEMLCRLKFIVGTTA
ncbi:N-arachidonyl glycine receptor-like [Chiloscyllium plagiosum]|uniref:N-arachidonyl glycine receptor-like n=1 Tax=Chiloscyllium plagiosum TaxID=36176 RepID=UPI001CB7D98C|nr:N-arachidonyl glycine receptor-like [Chiloscyllium plagiosum]